MTIPLRTILGAAAAALLAAAPRAGAQQPVAPRDTVLTLGEAARLA
jgi:hypothetical protein